MALKAEEVLTTRIYYCLHQLVAGNRGRRRHFELCLHAAGIFSRRANPVIHRPTPPALVAHLASAHCTLQALLISKIPLDRTMNMVLTARQPLGGGEGRLAVRDC